MYAGRLPTQPTSSSPTATLLVSCPDRTGLIAALSEFVFRHGGNIVDLDQHAERESGRFFMRLVFEAGALDLDRPSLASAIGELASRFDMAWELAWSDARPRIAVLASKMPHCLYEILLSAQLDELGGDVVMVVSNHEDPSAAVCRHFDVPFTHVPVEATDRATAEARQQALLDGLGVDLVVLARYMQILSPGFVARWPGKIINIHHSFLPAFVGARPYHQAKERGVKVIGATAHYVTAELDQGPIIEQDVCRVTHRDEVDDLVRKGRDLERQVLTRALRSHLQRRVLIHQNRTIVFG